MAEAGRMPTPEELAEQILALKIDDILLTTVTTLGQLAYAKLEAKQLDQARLAIDAIAALLPVLEGPVRPDILRDFNQLLANVRLAFASAVSSQAAASEEPSPADDGEAEAGEEPGPSASDERVEGGDGGS